MSSIDSTRAFFQQKLYPFQDRIIAQINEVETGFYLTGGTALSRGYLNHRFSDDLDYFTNANPRFAYWADLLIGKLSQSGEWSLAVVLREEQFARLLINSNELVLKIEMVKYVPSHIGHILVDSQLGQLDSIENIFANKISALAGRDEPKDIADIWAITRKTGLTIVDALRAADSKSAGLYPAFVARKLYQVKRTDWEAVRWVDTPSWEQYKSDLHTLAASLVIVD